MKTSITFYPNILKQSKKDKSIPIYIRLLHQNKKRERKLDVSINFKELGLWNRHLDRLEKKDTPVNNCINHVESFFLEWQKGNETENIKTSIDSLIDILVKPKSQELYDDNLVRYFDNYYEKIKQRSMLSKGTIKNYNKSINHLKKFLELKKILKIDLQNFSKSNAYDFKEYLSSKKTNGDNALCDVSTSSVIKKIKAIFQRAYEFERISRNPFNGIKLSNKSPQKPRLTINEVKNIKELDLGSNKSLEIYRDIFLFCCVTGLAYSDITSLKKSDIYLVSNGLILETKRQKTGILVKQFLVDIAKQLIEKYSGHNETHVLNTIFPKRSLKCINENLKTIAIMTNIEKNISSHIARHTCMQHLGESGIEDKEVRNTIMGWSKLGMMSANYYEVNERLLFAAKEKFNNYLNENLCQY